MDNIEAIQAFINGEEVFDVPRSNNLHTPLPEEGSAEMLTQQQKDEIIYAMTDAEYKAWVEEGEFPDRLVSMRDAELKKAAEKQKKKESAS